MDPTEAAAEGGREEHRAAGRESYFTCSQEEQKHTRLECRVVLKDEFVSQQRDARRSVFVHVSCALWSQILIKHRDATHTSHGEEQSLCAGMNVTE